MEDRLLQIQHQALFAADPGGSSIIQLTLVNNVIVFLKFIQECAPRLPNPEFCEPVLDLNTNRIFINKLALSVILSTYIFFNSKMNEARETGQPWKS